MFCAHVLTIKDRNLPPFWKCFGMFFDEENVNQFNILHKTKLRSQIIVLRRCIDFDGNITNCPSPIQSNFKDFGFSSFFSLFGAAHAINNSKHLSSERKEREKKSKDYFLVMPSVVVVLVSSRKKKNVSRKARCVSGRDSCFSGFEKESLSERKHIFIRFRVIY